MSCDACILVLCPINPKQIFEFSHEWLVFRSSICILLIMSTLINYFKDLKKKLEDISLFGGHWCLCFGFLVTSSRGFKARVDLLHAFLLVWSKDSDRSAWQPSLQTNVDYLKLTICHARKSISIFIAEVIVQPSLLKKTIILCSAAIHQAKAYSRRKCGAICEQPGPLFVSVCQTYPQVPDTV